TFLHVQFSLAPVSTLFPYTTLFRSHSRKKGLDGAVHGFDVEVERKIPVSIAAIENAAVMHIAGAVHQNIQCAEFARDRLGDGVRSEEHTSELQSQSNLVCRLLLEKK